MAKKRVVITGMGIVSCFGNEVDPFYKNLLEGRSGVGLIQKFPTDEFPTRIAAEVLNFDAGVYMEKKQARRADPCIQYAVVAGKKAIEDAGFKDQASLETLNRQRAGVLIGSGMGGMSVYEEGVQTMMQKGIRRVSPFFVPFIITNMGSAMLGMDLGFMGPTYSVSTACATANYAMVLAAEHIRNGTADLMITGGVEAPLLPMALAGFCAVKALSEKNDTPEKASRPWDKNRDGFVMGEGAGVLVFESLEHALKRGAKIYGEYLGGGFSSDAHHITEPHPEGKGVRICIENALADADVKPEQVNYINAHATSTPAGDMAEIRALKQVFKHPEKIFINSTKSMIGHCLGAAGGMEAIAVLGAIQHGAIHPTINLDDPEPDLGFIAPTKAEELKVNVAISNSFGFGGHNATVIFAPYRP